MTTSWMLDELVHAGPEHLDPLFIAGFDQKQGHPRPDDDIATLRDHGVGDTATVVDLGAGTGQFALEAAAHFQRVVAVDVSQPMVDFLRERANKSGLENVECVQAGFLGYEHSGVPADAVYTRHALHQLPDFWKALALQRIAAMLRPGGVLRLVDLIFDFQPAEAEQIIGSWFDHAATDPAQGYTRDDYAEHLRTEYSTYRWLLEPMLEATGFEIVEADFQGALFGSYTCITRPPSG